MKCTDRNEKKINSLRKIYIVGFWANYGTREYPFSGKYTKDGEPLVYFFNDHNGAFCEWQLIPIEYTTTGYVMFWTFDKFVAEQVAESLRTTYKLKQKG